ncbi:hypothetical protein [Aeromicrobium sp. Leaf289]|uniref:hypothetical protein n=1 Tax=Aeromicrobium sp. Leaf289 TaxID=1736324 RepID=UPI0012E1C6A0|nr:hypothetical protein [Aeromicrobium sp. Leaf289]
MAEPDARGPGRDGRDEFDDIVSRLDLDLPFPAEADEPDPAPVEEPAEPEPFELDDEPDPVDEQFYRRVDPGPGRPMHRGRAVAWGGLVGSPLLLMFASLAGQWLSSPVLLGAALTFVASAIYLIAQLPEHGPSQRDWPDDGAAL